MFEFDPSKSAANSSKHGIDFLAAQALWLDEQLLVISARTGKDEEPRWIAIGMIAGRHWSAIFTRRDLAIRLISVRRARKEEVDLYESTDI
ncbi:BrnT family toxin [Sphingobium algorifonticola]|nr:BrnT family toxin [Sphingobium algorifonticola]